MKKRHSFIDGICWLWIHVIGHLNSTSDVEIRPLFVPYEINKPSLVYCVPVKFFPALINAIFTIVLQCYNCTLLRIALYWQMGQEFEQHGSRGFSILPYLLHFRNCEPFSSVEKTADVYVSDCVSVKDWAIVFLQVFEFYCTCKNVQILQF